MEGLLSTGPTPSSFLVKTRARPKTKLPKLVEIVPDMYPDLFFLLLFWDKVVELVGGGFVVNKAFPV